MKHRFVCFRDVQWLSCYFIWNYFRWWYRVTSCSTCLLICFIKPISHLQTPLIIIKSCHSPYRDLWAHRKWERASELSRHKSTCKCDTFHQNLREWVELLLIAAIPHRNSSSALCSLLITRLWMMRAALLCCRGLGPDQISCDAD